MIGIFGDDSVLGPIEPWRSLDNPILEAEPDGISCVFSDLRLGRDRRIQISYAEAIALIEQLNPGDVYGDNLAFGLAPARALDPHANDWKLVSERFGVLPIRRAAPSVAGPVMAVLDDPDNHGQAFRCELVTISQAIDVAITKKLIEHGRYLTLKLHCRAFARSIRQQQRDALNDGLAMLRDLVGPLAVMTPDGAGLDEIRSLAQSLTESLAEERREHRLALREERSTTAKVQGRLADFSQALAEERSSHRRSVASAAHREEQLAAEVSRLKEQVPGLEVDASHDGESPFEERDSDAPAPTSNRNPEMPPPDSEDGR